MAESNEIMVTWLVNIFADEIERLWAIEAGNAETRGEKIWATAARNRMAELARHPGHDGPTVCACTECVLWTLLDIALAEEASR